MRAGRTHKSTLERSLLAVRAHIGAALEALDEEDQSQASSSPSVFSRIYGSIVGAESPPRGRDTAREELEAAEKALRAAELQLGDSRMKDGVVPAFSHVQDEQTREWLKLHFAETADSKSGACSEEEIGGPSDEETLTRKPSRRITHRRLSFVQRDASVHKALTSEDVKHSLDKAGLWDFDALGFCQLEDLGGRPISALGVHLEAKYAMISLLHHAGKVADLKKFQEAFLSFMGHLDELYRPDAVYHGSHHAVDVMSSVVFFMNSEYLGARTRKSKGEYKYMALIAAAIHDVGHPGVNNSFLTKTMDPLALRYSDRSVLESMHLATAFETMASFQDCNWFAMLDAASQKTMRSGLISMVLATDMQRHAEHIKSLEAFDKDSDDSGGLTFLLETVLHAADISNPAKPQQHMLGWTKRVTEEFWSQGDEETRLDLEISPLCDREDGMKTVPKGQIGFISFVVLPFLNNVNRLIPETKEALDLIEENKAFWRQMQDENKTYDEIFADVL